MAVAFSPDGARLVFGSTALSAYAMGSKRITKLHAPRLDVQDAIGFVAVNSVRPEEIAVATFGNDIFRTTDGGQAWQLIARDGVGT